MGGGPAAPRAPARRPAPLGPEERGWPLPASESRPPSPGRSQPTRHSSGAHVTWSSRQKKMFNPSPTSLPLSLWPPPPPSPGAPFPSPDGQLLTELQGPGLTPELDHRGAAPGLIGRFLDEPWGNWGRGGGREPVGGSLGLQPSGLKSQVCLPARGELAPLPGLSSGDAELLPSTHSLLRSPKPQSSLLSGGTWWLRSQEEQPWPEPGAVVLGRLRPWSWAGGSGFAELAADGSLAFPG